jgi:mannose-1-phosphate guanylyltransferase
VPRAGLEPLRIEWLPAALSLRRFARIHTATRTAVARIEAPEDPAGRPAGVAPEPPHEPIRALLERAVCPCRAGSAATRPPASICSRTSARCRSRALRRRSRRRARGALPRGVRARAADPGDRAAPGVAAFARSLDAALFAYKADLVARYGLAARGRDATPAEAAVVRDTFAWIAAEMARAPQRLAHRDYQSSNLYVREGAAPGERLRMIDLQGAFLAPPEYDLVCLLRDSYVELPEAEIAEHCAAVRPALPDAPDAESFARRFDLLTLTRKGKDHARFLYAARERGDERFLGYAPTPCASCAAPPRERARATRASPTSPRCSTSCRSRRARDDRRRGARHAARAAHRLLPKPAVPVRGIPLIAYQLALLAHHGVREVVVNTHHLAGAPRGRGAPPLPARRVAHLLARARAARHGRGIRRVAAFLRESDPCLLVGGDMLLDVDLGALVRQHARERRGGDAAAARGPAQASFGSIGVDRAGVVCRIGSRFSFGAPGEEARAGSMRGPTSVSARALDTLPEREAFGHFDHWLAPRLAAGARDVRGAFLPCTWEPVGTLAEYLAVNRQPARLSYLDADAAARAAGRALRRGQRDRRWRDPRRRR